MYNIVICDDDLNFINYLKERLLISGLNLCDVTFYEFTSGKDFIHNFTNIPVINQLILDIQMPEMDGDQVAQQFRIHYPTSLLVFCSGVYQPSVKSFLPNPFRYLLKEYSEKQLDDELRIIIEEVKSRHSVPIIVGKRHSNIVRLEPDEIMYASVARKKSHLHINPKCKVYDFEDNIMYEHRLSDLYNILKDYYFAYAHNSYIVNLKFVKRLTGVELELTDGTILSVSRSKMSDFQKSYAKYLSMKY